MQYFTTSCKKIAKIMLQKVPFIWRETSKILMGKFFLVLKLDKKNVQNWIMKIIYAENDSFTA